MKYFPNFRDSRTTVYVSATAVGLLVISGVAWWLLREPSPPTAVATTATQGGSFDVTGIGYSGWIVVASLLTTVASLTVALHMIYWRKALEGGQTSIVPNELLRYLKSHRKKFEQVAAGISMHLEQSDRIRTEYGREISDVKASLRVFQDSLAQKDAEIARLKRGADAEVFRRFLARFLRVHTALSDDIHELQNANQSAEKFENLLQLLDDALLECGVETFSPDIGESVRNAFGISENYRLIETPNSDLHLSIANVDEPGFLLRTAEKPICLRPASVAVYVSSLEEK